MSPRARKRVILAGFRNRYQYRFVGFGVRPWVDPCDRASLAARPYLCEVRTPRPAPSTRPPAPCFLAPVRELCRRCLRPVDFCLCAGCPPVRSRTRVVLLQHPREARLAICSAWMTRLALENAELHRGVRFGDHPRVREVARQPGTALLFPGEGARPAGARSSPVPETLVVIDGTWLQAEKMLRVNPELAALPRISVEPDRPSGYGALRREPAAHTLSTIEAVALALGAFEGDARPFQPMCEAFRRLVERQLACARGDRRSPRHRAPRADAPGPVPGSGT